MNYANCIRSPGEDVGKACANIIAQRDRYIGREVTLSGEVLTRESVLGSFQIVYPNVQFEILNERDNMDSFKAKYGEPMHKMYSRYFVRMLEGGNLSLSKELNPKIHHLESYLNGYRSRYDF